MVGVSAIAQISLKTALYPEAGRDFEHLSCEWRGEWWFLSLLTYLVRVVGQEGTAVDVAGCSLLDVDGSSVLRRVFAPTISSGSGAGISSMFRSNGEVHLPQHRQNCR